MSEHPEWALLLELADLYKKYGPEVFEQLATKLSDPKVLEQLVCLLQTAAKAARKRTERKTLAVDPTDRPRAYREHLVQLRQTTSEKATLLLSLFDKLLARIVLPTAHDLQEFALRNGLLPPPGSPRPLAAIRLCKALEPLSTDQLSAMLADLQAVPENEKNSLAEWTRIILDRDRQQQTSN